MDPAKLAVREKGLKRAFFALIQKHSMTRMDKNYPKTPTREGKTRQQKRHSIKSALKNGRGGGIRLPVKLLTEFSCRPGSRYSPCGAAKHAHANSYNAPPFKSLTRTQQWVRSP